MKKIIENQKGFAMPLALMVMLLVMVLGMALWQYGTSETLQVARAEKNMKAYFLARSGMDITQEILQKDMEKLLGDANDFYFSGTLLNDDKKLVFSANAPEITGKDVVIKVDKDETWNSVKKTGKIIATGYSGNVSDVISCKFEYQDNSPASAKELDWVDDSGKISNKGNLDREEERPVTWSASEMIYDGDNAERVFEAPVMYFEDYHSYTGGYEVSLKIEGNSNRLGLNADFLSFNRSILFTYQNDNQSPVLTIQTYVNQPSDIVLNAAKIAALIPRNEDHPLVDLAGAVPLDDRKYGLLYLEKNILLYLNKVNLLSVDVNDHEHVIGNGYYLFPEGIELKDGNDELERLIPITEDEAQAIKGYFGVDSYKGKLIFSDYADK